MKKHYPIVTDPKELETITNHFNQAEALINQRIYNSQSDEKNRAIGVNKSKVLTGNFKDISYAIQQGILYELHPELEIEDVKEGDFFFSSQATDKLPIKVAELNPQTISLLWYGPDGIRFQKTFNLKPLKKNKVKVDYSDFVKGFKTIDDSSFKRLYLSKQKLNFKIWMNQVTIDLTTDENVKNKLINKNEHFHQKLVEKVN